MHKCTLRPGRLAPVVGMFVGRYIHECGPQMIQRITQAVSGSENSPPPDATRTSHDNLFLGLQTRHHIRSLMRMHKGGIHKMTSNRRIGSSQGPRMLRSTYDIAIYKYMISPKWSCFTYQGSACYFIDFL